MSSDLSLTTLPSTEKIILKGVIPAFSAGPSEATFFMNTPLASDKPTESANSGVILL
jgi:hypothetical protein